MIFEFKCLKCKSVFEDNTKEKYRVCPKCESIAKKQFHACTNIYVPAYFHTNKSDIFSDTEWQDLKKNPDIERA